MMRTFTSFAFAAFLTGVLPAGAASAQNLPANQPIAGEVRALAVASNNADAIARLHRDGWLETRGQLLPTRDYPELFAVLGRAWTDESVSANRFAIPLVADRAYRGVSSEDPFGVLGGDAITSGRPSHVGLKPHPLSYWIYVGRAVPPDARAVAAR